LGKKLGKFLFQVKASYFFPKEKVEGKYRIQNIKDSPFENRFIWLLMKEKAKYEIFTL